MEKAHLSLLFASSKSTRKASLRQASLNEFRFDQAKYSDLKALSFKRPYARTFNNMGIYR